MPAAIILDVPRIVLKPKTAPVLKKRGNGVPTCPHGGKEYTDISHNERFQGSFTCHDCGTKFPLADYKKHTALVPKHTIPIELHTYRKMLEAQERASDRTQRVR